MEIFRIENTKYSIICPKCKNILKFKIYQNKFEVEGECGNGHIFKNISFCSFINDFIKSTSLIKYIKCNKCFISNKTKSFLCQTCNKLFCINCINQHLKEENHSNAKFYIKNNKLCLKHNKSFYFFCNDCKCYLCENCRIDHSKHFIISLIDIFPNNEKKESMEKRTLKFKEKIDNLKETFLKKKRDINKKFEKLEHYFDFLIDINDKLFQKYNYSIFDIYNYENFNYIYNFIDNEEIFNEKVYLDYILNDASLKGKGKKEEEQKINNDKIININDNNLEYLLYKDYNKLNYFKDNLFYEIDYNNRKFGQNYLKLYEFTEFEFKYIAEYNLDKYTKIKSFNPAKYGNYFLINFRQKKNIKILKYDSANKEFILSKKEIKSNKTSFFDRNFNDVIDCKNGNILTVDEDGLILWEKNNNKKFYNKKMAFPKFYYKLYNINGKIFMAKDSEFITFFSYDTMEPIKSSNFNETIDFISQINNKFLILKTLKKYLLISLKYFDICQIIECNDSNLIPLKAKDNILIQYAINNNKIKIIKNVLSEEKGYFIEEKISILNGNYSFDPKILITNNNYLFVGDFGSISIFSGIFH